MMGRYLTILDAAAESSTEVRSCDKSDKSDKSPHSVASVSYVASSDSRESTATDWRTRYDSLIELRVQLGGRSHVFAETLAWGELQNEWLRLHGELTPAWQCAGCGEPIGGQPVFAFPDGARAHDDLGCIAQYGKRWRSAATAALVEMGLPKPAKVPEDDP